MGEILFWLITVGLTAVLSFNLGVRRERGRQIKFEAVSRVPGPKAKQGVRLNRIKIRR